MCAVYVVGVFRDAASAMAHSLKVYGIAFGFPRARAMRATLYDLGHDAHVYEACHNAEQFEPGQEFGEVSVYGFRDLSPDSEEVWEDVPDPWRLGRTMRWPRSPHGCEGCFKTGL